MQEFFHDIVVIGASAGGLPPLLKVLRGLPANLPASIFIVVHRSADAPDDSMIWTLQRASLIPCKVPQHNEIIQRGCIYVAPSNQHMLLKEDKILITRGPRENYFRPSIDTTLQDGTAGMEAIKRCGGLCLVQLPEDAAFPSMPQTVLSNLEVDYSVSSSEMHIVLEELIQRPASNTQQKPHDLVLEADIAERYVNNHPKSIKAMSIEKTTKELDQVGSRTAVSCPECGGSIWRMKDGAVERYRCHLGHAFTIESMLGRNKESLEETLWVALRMLEERRYVLVTLAEEIAAANQAKSDAYTERAEELQIHVERIRQVITNFNGYGLTLPEDENDPSAQAS
jgi:two-component system chemotaxis response regulator CheB